MIYAGSHPARSTVKSGSPSYIVRRSCWGLEMTSLVGSPKQRQQLQVPLMAAKCGKRESILWQVSISSTEEKGKMQQVILVWDVAKWSDISKIVDRVIMIQKPYSEQFERRCCSRSPVKDQFELPSSFVDTGTHLIELPSSQPELDIGTVDPVTIKITNKFYILTKFIIRSSIANNLAVEFILNLPKDEIQYVIYFQGSGLILE